MKKLVISVICSVLGCLGFFIILFFVEKFIKEQNRRTIRNLLEASLHWGLGFGVGYYFFSPDE